MADDPDELAAGLFGQLRRDRLPLVLEGGEFDLHQLVLAEDFVEALDEGVGRAGLAEGEHGFELLGKALEFADGGVG